MEPFIGQIMMFGFNFPPRGWARCDGQLLAINSNQALFALLGTTFGGDGRTTFGLPDLRGRTAMHPGQGPGLTSRRWGERGGAERVTLTTANLAAHTHEVSIDVTDQVGSSNEGNNHILAKTVNNNYSDGASNGALTADASTSTGGGSAVSIVQPFLGIYFCIALVGVFPSRN